jgi:trk system potassium uptake protein
VIKNKMKFIIIVGCGRLGSYLANALSQYGHSIVVIDSNADTFASLSGEFSGFRFEGDATQYAVLEKAKASKADILVATTREDNINMMVAQMAQKIFNVPRVVARVVDPKREEIYRDFGVETVCPTIIAAEIFLDVMGASPVESKKRTVN